MAGFARFNRATKAEVPNLVDAELRAAALREEQRRYNLEKGQELGANASDWYSNMVEDKTPIRDFGKRIVDSLRSPEPPAPTDVDPQYLDKFKRPANLVMERQGGYLPDSLDSQVESVMPGADGGITDMLIGEEVPVGAATDAVANTATDTATDAVANTATDTATDAVADSALKGIPLVGALRGGYQLANGDVEGALGTGAKVGLAALGPAGIAAGLGLGLMGV
jgi:hypothetical protein